MGLYNSLHVRSHACPFCGEVQDWSLQFRYGECSLNQYTLGDQLLWDGRDYGRPVAGPARVRATSLSTRPTRTPP